MESKTPHTFLPGSSWLPALWPQTSGLCSLALVPAAVCWQDSTVWPERLREIHPCLKIPWICQNARSGWWWCCCAEAAPFSSSCHDFLFVFIIQVLTFSLLWEAKLPLPLFGYPCFLGILYHWRRRQSNNASVCIVSKISHGPVSGFEWNS